MQRILSPLALVKILLVCAVVTNTQSLTKDCGAALMMSCTMQINNAFQKCAAEREAKGCIEILLQNGNCLGCLCNLIPAVCMNDELATEGEQQQVISLNRAINKLATCSAAQLSKCQQVVHFVVNKCNREADCVKKELTESQCQMCLCQVVPQMCTPNELEAAKKSQEESKQEPVQFFEQLLNRLPEEFENRQKVQQTKSGLDELMKLGGDLFKGNGMFSQMLPGQSLSNNDGGSDTNTNKNRPDMPSITEAMGFLSKLNMDRRAKVSESEVRDSPFADVQQKIMQRVMSNPQLMAQMLPVMGGQSPDFEKILEALKNDPALAALHEGRGESEEAIEENFENQQQQDSLQGDEADSLCTDSLLKDCQWEILRVLPACIGQNANKCLSNALGTDNRCGLCVCDVVPKAC